MSNLKGCFSHKSDDWATPEELYNYIISKGFTDPCPLHSEEDNLNKVYAYGSRIYINPPYSKLKDWVQFIKNNTNTTRLLLIPARTDTQYFHELLTLKPFIYFIKGRLKFGSSKDSAPFPSLLLLFLPYETPFATYHSTSIEEIIRKDKLK